MERGTLVARHINEVEEDRGWNRIVIKVLFQNRRIAPGLHLAEFGLNDIIVDFAKHVLVLIIKRIKGLKDLLPIFGRLAIRNQINPWISTIGKKDGAFSSPSA